ncbi:MAG: hypothetical protein Q8Q22_00560 [bacterium]|nr:hypothetical protein [bacterium]
MEIRIADQKKLWGKSGGRCAICRTDLIEIDGSGTEATLLVGEMAHICGEKEGSARFDVKMTETERGAEINLILLCPTDHTKIDKDEVKYTVDKLHTLKKEHELWIQDAIREQMPNVTFAELEVTIGYLIRNTSIVSDESISFVKPKEKITKNSLSVEIENLITMGMGRVKEVKDYLNTNPDIYFADKLRNGLVSKYNEFKEEKLDADTIFLELLKFSSANSRDSRIKAAALSVVVYFFEACDIFEK